MKKKTTGISRRDFIKGAGGMMGLATMSMLTAGCGESAANGTTAAAGTTAAPQNVEQVAGVSFKAGTYNSVQSTPYATVDVKCTFSDKALTDVSYEVIKTSDSDYFGPFASQLEQYCAQVVEAGKADGVDGVTGATFCSDAIKDGVNACMAQALGIPMNVSVSQGINPQVDGYDSFNGDLAEVFAPITLGNMTLPNRVIKAAGSSPWNDANKSKIPVACELYGTMVENGVSLVLFPSSIFRAAGILPDYLQVKGDLNEAMASVKPLIDTIHAKGGKIGYQLVYGGGAPTVADSVINEAPIEKFDAFIEEVGIGAARSKEIGIDCIEIKGASADALNGFLSRRVNRREDEYGPQSIENRTRLFCRIIKKIKEVNGADYPVGALINGVEENDVNLGDNELFLTIEEAKEIAKSLVAAGADWIQLRVGANGQEMNIWAPDVQHIANDIHGITGYGTQFDYSSHFGGMVDGSKSGFGAFLPMAKAIKEAVDVPVGCAAYTDLRVGPDYINDAIARGELDLVFMNRPLNADPELVRKMQEGNRADVRPCMKCMHCHDSVSTGNKYKTSCRTNAANSNALTPTMPEGATPLPAEVSRKIMVIGAGPAGMEAARVAAERGHSVTLYDAGDTLGGLMGFARGVKGDHERFGDYLTYYAYQLEKNKVNVQLRTTVDAAMVKEQKPDAVVVAVGGLRETKVTGTAKTPVLDPEQAFGAANLGDTVAILGAGVQAVDFASYLVSQGKKVVMIHSEASEAVDKGQSGWFKIFMIPHLQSKGTKFWHNAKVLGVEDGGVKITTDAGLEKLIACDSVVEFYNMIPNTALADELKNAGFEVHAVGDCANPHNIQKAVLTGNLAARKL